MGIGFNEIPSSLRIPGTYIEFDNRLAGNASINFKVLVAGQRLSTGTVAAGVPTRVNTVEQAEEFFGRGSMLAEQFRAIKNAEQFMETWAIASDEVGAGSAAAGTITATGAATENGTLAVYIAGKRIRVGVTSGDSQDTIATAIAAAVNADTSLPVTAVVNGVTTNQVDITCRWKGETGNDIDVRMNYFDERTPAGVVMTFGGMATGATNPDITATIAAMGDEWYNWIVMPFTDTANLVLLETELDSRWGPLRQIGMRAFTAYRGTHAASGSFGNARNNPHITCMGTNIVPEPPYIWASINAIVGAKYLSIDPARPLQRLDLTGLKAPVKEKRWTDTERNQLLFDGIATYTVDNDGSVVIERQITMYQTNSASLADDSYLNINTPETLERIRFEQRAMFAQKYPRHKLAEDTMRVPPGQAIMQPKIAKAELLVLYTEMEQRGWVQDYEGYKEALLTEVDANDRDRLNVYDSPLLVGQLRVTAVHTEFRR
ncbi:MAG: phage tail sheath subtilisin-like domain-containing protein [Methylophaga sp.]|nr:phage tail sheath subtilisin-like domain-containing protein [Methylophaga sp.]